MPDSPSHWRPASVTTHNKPQLIDSPPSHHHTNPSPTHHSVRRHRTTTTPLTSTVYLGVHGERGGPSVCLPECQGAVATVAGTSGSLRTRPALFTRCLATRRRYGSHQTGTLLSPLPHLHLHTYNHWKTTPSHHESFIITRLNQFCVSSWHCFHSDETLPKTG